MLRIEKLTKKFTRRGGFAVDRLSFEVNNGEIVGFVGLNGAGKTTTFRIISGVTLPSSGSVIVDEFDIVGAKAKASENIGWVPEIPNFELNVRAKDLMLYFAGYHQISKDEATKKTESLFATLNLSGFEDKHLRTYSLGMKKRFSLAAALLSDPSNLLFDEILNGLDPQGLRFARSLMIYLKSRGKAILLSSHNLSEIENLSDRVVFIHKGRIVKIASRTELSQVDSDGRILRIVIENLNEDTLAYLRTLGEVRIQENTIWLSKFLLEPTLIGKELFQRGIQIREFNLQKTSLEDYFFHLIGVSQNNYDHK